MDGQSGFSPSDLEQDMLDMLFLIRRVTWGLAQRKGSGLDHSKGLLI